MIPNVYVQVSLTELAPDDGNLYDDPKHSPYRLDFAEAKVSRDPKRLSVEVTPHDAECRPGATTSVDFHVEDASGDPAEVQVTAMVVDEAVLQMTGYRPPDLVQAVFPDRDLSLCLFDNRPLVIRTGEKLEALPKGWGYGGGEGGEYGTPASYLRKEFLRLAHFDADLRTDANGDATCEFKLPDNLTTWRVLAVAVSSGNEFGMGDATFLTNQPLMLLGLIPRFARVDDSITTGVAINNQSGAGGKATVTCSMTEGDDLLADAGEPLTEQSVELADNRTGAVRFPKLAKGVGKCTLEFGCDFEAAGVREADRLQLPLVIQEPGHWETVTVAREVPASVDFPIEITDAVRHDLGFVRVGLASTALGDLAPDVEWLLEYPYGCAEQVSSRLLGLLAIRGPAERLGIAIESDEPLDAVIARDLKRLLDCQRGDGGFGYWPYGGSSSPLLTATVAPVLADASRRGYDVPATRLKRLKEYLEFERGYPYRDPIRLHYQVLQAEALHALGEDYTRSYADLYMRRAEMSLLYRVRLDGLLWQSPEWSEQASELYEEIKENEWITERGAHLEEWGGPDPWSFFGSGAALSAAGLGLDLLVDPTNERVAKTAGALSRDRQARRWRSTYDTARVLQALAAYADARESTAPGFTASVVVDGGPVTAYTFRGYELGLQSFTAPLAELGKGEHTLTLTKAGVGTLSSTVARQ